jgi:hypothetical protein
VTFTTQSGITYPLTLVGMVDNVTSAVSGRRNAIYRLVGPPYSASGYVTVTFSGYVQYGTVAGVANFKGVDQSTPLGTYVSAVYTDSVSSSTDLFTDRTLTVTTTAGDLVYDSVALFAQPPDGFVTATVGQTELWNVLRDRTDVRVRGAASTKLAVDATTVMTWTASGVPGGTTYPRLRSWAMCGVPIKASPTAARLNSLTAGATRGGVRVAWETASEVASLGFRVYRATSANGQRERLTASLIPSQAPGSASGSHYQFVDETAQPGLTYYYWLELVDVDGAMELDGPVSARVSLYIKIPPPREQ